MKPYAKKVQFFYCVKIIDIQNVLRYKTLKKCVSHMASCQKKSKSANCEKKKEKKEKVSK